MLIFLYNYKSILLKCLFGFFIEFDNNYELLQQSLKKEAELFLEIFDLEIWEFKSEWFLLFKEAYLFFTSFTTH